MPSSTLQHPQEKSWKTAWRRCAVLLCASLALGSAHLPPATADEIVNPKTVITIGSDVTPVEESAILNELGVTRTGSDIVDKTTGEKASIIRVTNAEEHTMLAGIFPEKVIGKQALSCAKVSLTGKGISVNTKNITIPKEIFANVVVTAGVENANINATAARMVSGTGALTGILKAFEAATGKTLDPKRKKVAVEELALTSQIAGQNQDSSKVTQFLVAVKKEVAEKKPSTPQEYKEIVVNVANNLHIELNENLINTATTFAQHFSGLNLSWSSLLPQFENMGAELKNTFGLDKLKEATGIDFEPGFIAKCWNFVRSTITSILSALQNLLNSL